jgi:uncharacterized protein
LRIGTLFAAAAAFLASVAVSHAEITVKIGVPNNFSDLYADIGGAGTLVATRVAVEDFDTPGKGLRVEIVSADHQNKPETRKTNVGIWATIFLASMLSSVVGFAFSAIAGAILFHIDNSYLHAVQTMLVASISLQSFSVFYLRKNIVVRALAPFLAGGAATLMLGVYVVTHTKVEALLVLTGTILILYGLFTIRGKVPRLHYTGIAGDVCSGALGGITGPVAAFPGAFVAIWCSLKGWDKSRQRGVTQPYILTMQIFTLGALSVMSGPRVALDWPLLQYPLPAIAGAVFGLKLFERLNDRQFLSMIAALLVVSGIAMVAKVL